MTINEYQCMAARTINRNNEPQEKEQHALMGMCSEVGELQAVYQKIYQGHPFDLHHAMSELGDLMWFAAEWCTSQGISLETVAEMNIEKLRKRYPEGFDEERSRVREEGDI